MNELLALKKKFEEVTGEPFDPPKAGSSSKKSASNNKAPAAPKVAAGDEEGVMTSTGNAESLVITPRDTNYAQVSHARQTTHTILMTLHLVRKVLKRPSAA